MHKIWPSDNKQMSIYITILCKGKKNFRVWAEDYDKKDSKYADREIEVNGKRQIYFSFPVSPKQLFIGCLNANNLADKDFEVIFEEKELKKYNIDIDSDTRDFQQLAIIFSQVCGFKTPAPNGTLYHSLDKKFNIKYLPVIRDLMTGTPLSTPARIGHNTGLIEAAYVKMRRYTIPMRIAIMDHEYSHKYKNPKLGLAISNEFGADINGAYLYLGMGFSKIDIICVFANVFLKAQTPENIKRMRNLIDFIQRFENEEFAKVEYV